MNNKTIKAWCNSCKSRRMMNSITEYQASGTLETRICQVCKKATILTMGQVEIKGLPNNICSFGPKKRGFV